MEGHEMKVNNDANNTEGWNDDALLDDHINATDTAPLFAIPLAIADDHALPHFDQQRALTALLRQHHTRNQHHPHQHMQRQHEQNGALERVFSNDALHVNDGDMVN